MANSVQAAFSSKLEGFAELRLQLRRLGDEVENRGMTNAVAAGGAVLMEDARRRIPKDTGALKQALAIVVRKHARGRKDALAKVGIDKRVRGPDKRRPVRYAHLVEFGHKRPNGTIVPPQPFLRPALLAKTPAIKRAMEIALRLEIQRALRRNKPR